MKLTSDRVKTMYIVWLSWLAMSLGLKKVHLRACRDSLDIGAITNDHCGNQDA